MAKKQLRDDSNNYEAELVEAEEELDDPELPELGEEDGIETPRVKAAAETDDEWEEDELEEDGPEVGEL